MNSTVGALSTLADVSVRANPSICRGHFVAAFVAPDADHSAVSMGE